MMKRNALPLLAIVGLMLLCGGCRHTDRQAQKFTQVAERTNRSCPMRLSETVTLDSTRYDAHANAVSYYYTLNGEADHTIYIKENYESLKQALREAVDNSVEMEDYRRYGTSIHYIYYSATSGKQLAEFNF